MTSQPAAEPLPTATHLYTCYAAFARRTPAPEQVVGDAEAVTDGLADAGVTVRGIYDVTAMPAWAHVLVWLHGPQPERLQDAVRAWEREVFGGSAELVWSAMGVHRQAEFAREHSPAFSRGVEPRHWLTVYPFVRSYDWYLLPDAERRDMLAEHGRMGRDFPQVLSNTVAAFALGDYEWLLGLEADELTDLVDLMRHLRGAAARRHTRLETPFFTGHRMRTDELPLVLR